MVLAAAAVGGAAACGKFHISILRDLLSFPRPRPFAPYQIPKLQLSAAPKASSRRPCRKGPNFENRTTYMNPRAFRIGILTLAVATRIGNRAGTGSCSQMTQAVDCLSTAMLSASCTMLRAMIFIMSKPTTASVWCPFPLLLPFLTPQIPTI